MHSEILALARHDLAVSAAAMWPGFELARHHLLLIEAFESMESGDAPRLAASTPPRHGKSLLAQLFVSWFLGRHPDRSVIVASYAQDLADDFGRRVRNFIQDDRHRCIFPDCQLTADSAAMHRFNLTRGGSFYSVGRGASITGRGADLALVDDLFKDRAEAISDAIRRSVHEWYAHVFYTRLHPRAPVALIGTRWHKDDVHGRQVSQQPGLWKVLNLPAIAEQNESFRLAGAALWPSRYPLAVLQEIRATIGGNAFTCLYQGQPAAAGGAIFKREYWRFYKEAPAFQRILQSWDTAFKKGTENDYSVCTTWGVTATGYYVLHVSRNRLEFPELKRQVIATAAQWKPSEILIEDKASGQSLLQELRRDTALPIRAIKVDSDKIARAQAATPTIEAGRVFLPEATPWLADLLDEHASFPNGAHDDQVDSATQFINHVRGTGNYTLIEWYKQQAALETAGVKPAEDDVSACTSCGSTFIQRIPGGKRCGQCGAQFSPARTTRNGPSRKDVFLRPLSLLPIDPCP